MKPSKDQYFMDIARAVSARADCVGRKVGAVIIMADRIVSTGYNGTPENVANCSDGACYRCKNRDAFGSGNGYDVCICVHAEQNALLNAARFGISVEGGTIYSTVQPCFGCTKELLQAGIRDACYVDAWAAPNPTLQAELEKLQAKFPDGIRQLKMEASSGEMFYAKYGVAETSHVSKKSPEKV